MEKAYGIKVTLPGDDTLAMEHLLGPNWDSYRWFESADLRDRIYRQMQEQPENYRQGDNVTIVLEKINP